MDEQKRKITDLKVIEVVTDGPRDKVYLLKPKKMLAFVVWSGPARHCRIWVNHRKMQPLGDGVWRGAAEAYVMWKKTMLKDFKAANYHGHLKDGRQHPWTRRLGTRRRNPPPEDEDVLM